jgi:hypothetical protein
LDDRFFDAIEQLQSRGMRSFSVFPWLSPLTTQPSDAGEPIKSKLVLNVMNVPGLRRSQVQTRIQRWRSETTPSVNVRGSRSSTNNSNNSNNNSNNNDSASNASTSMRDSSSSGTRETDAGFIAPLSPIVVTPPPPLTLEAPLVSIASPILLVPLQSSIAPTAAVKRRTPSAPTGAPVVKRQIVGSTTTRTTATTQTKTVSSSVTTAATARAPPTPAAARSDWNEFFELPIEEAARARLRTDTPTDEFDYNAL